MKSSKKAFHEAVAQNLIEQLKQGTAPWQKPWRTGEVSAFLPMNPTTGKRYKGINTLQLMSQGHSDSRWLTYKQAISLGAQVRKDEKGTQVQYWKFVDERTRKDDTGRPVLNSDGEPIKDQVRLERPRAFYASVFNAEQIDNLPTFEVKTPDWEPIKRAEEILQASNAVIKHGENDSAFYRLATDSIHLPHKNQFETPDRYYATALHELGHWSGNETRLNRDLFHPFGSEGYAKEELRAEIASMILDAELGIGHDPGQHAAYVGSWIKVLKEDPLEIFRAAADAEKIQDYVLSFSKQQDVVEEEKVKIGQISQQTATATQINSLSPDLAVIAAQNIAAFKDLTHGMPEKELHNIHLIAEARKFYQSGSIDGLEFEEVAENKLGFKIPADWSGRIQVQGNAIQKDASGNELVVSADSVSVEPQFFGVYALRDDNTFQWLKDMDTELEAKDLADRLTLIDAASEKSEYEKAVKLASIHKNRLQRDPRSTEEDVLAAKDYRKKAQSIAMSQEQDHQKRIREMENKSSDKPTRDEPANHKQSRQQNSMTRQYLVVPYIDKDLAKAAGASWDNTAKSWFVGENADISALQRWFPENVSSQQEPMMDPQAEFAELLRSHGCIVHGHHPVMDSTKQRIKVEGDKPHEKSGFYVAHLDGHPAGYIINNRTKFETRWKAKGYVLTDEQKAALNAETAIKQQNRKAGLHAQQLKVAEAIRELLLIAPNADSAQPYLLDKNARSGDLKIVPQNADALPADSIIKIGKDWQEAKALRESNPDNIVLTAGDLLLAAQDIDGQIWSVQTIQPGGAKFFVTGSKKESNFHVIDGKKQGLAALITAPAIVIAEGYATADTLSQALNCPVVAAFDSGNLPKVAQVIHEKYPGKAIIIAGDDDSTQESINGNNPGREKAQEAAELVNGVAVFPRFAPGEQVSQKLSDFNDLANKSTLGFESVKRQVGSVIKKALEQVKVEKLQNGLEQNQQTKQKRALAR